MDIEGSVYSTAELLSLRYPISTSPNTSPCSTGSLLLSSPWPISPSPPSSSSMSSSPPTITEGTLLSLSSSSSSSSYSPPSSVPSATSPELGLPATTHTAVIFTTTPGAVSSSAPALALVDPVSPLTDHTSPHALEVAHAPGKSILCVHEQDHGDLIHFSTSNGQLNHVNGNGSGNGSRGTGSNPHPGMDGGDKAVQSLELNNNNSSSIPTNTDGNLFPTLILTSAGPASSTGDMIPMRLYASLTSVPTTSTTSINPNATTSSILGSVDDASLSGATCILMTTQQHPHDDLHQLVSSSTHHHHHHHGLLDNDDENNNSGTTFTLEGFTTLNQTANDTDSTNIDTIGQQQSSLGTTMLSMDDCYDGSKPHHDDHDDLTLTKLTSSVDDFSSSHGKLKDILMNGNSHHTTLLHSSNQPTGDTYILRDLQAAYNNNGSSTNLNSTLGINNGNGQGQLQQRLQDHHFVIPKEEDELDELKLHSSEQSSFNEAINSIYNSGQHHSHHAPFCSDSNGDLIMVTDTHDLDSVYSSGVISSVGVIAPTSTASEGGASSWNPNSDCGRTTLPTISIIDEALILKDEDDTLGMDDEDLLQAKEEVDLEDDDFQDGSGGKGELKCKFCGFVCCSKSSLGIHERRHTGERPFACKYCGRLFNSAQCCKHHERLHTGDKPFQCSYCGKKYAVSTRLKRHERVHTREEPYKCTECNKTFRWFDAFRDHRNTHTGVPLYLCSVCGKTFTSYLKFYYHERGHLMKKERDRDRLAKQRQSMGTNGVKAPPRPIPSHTIDIIKSLQQNSSACVISSMLTPSVPQNNRKVGTKGQKKASKTKRDVAGY